MIERLMTWVDDLKQRKVSVSDLLSKKAEYYPYPKITVVDLYGGAKRRFFAGKLAGLAGSVGFLGGVGLIPAGIACLGALFQEADTKQPMSEWHLRSLVILGFCFLTGMCLYGTLQDWCDHHDNLVEQLGDDLFMLQRKFSILRKSYDKICVLFEGKWGGMSSVFVVVGLKGRTWQVLDPAVEPKLDLSVRVLDLR